MPSSILKKVFLIAGLMALGLGAVYIKRQLVHDDLVVYSNNNGVTVLDTPIPISPLALQGRKGAFNKQDLLHKWSFMFFGYTHCPDVCPTTLTLLQQVDAALGATDKVQTLFVTLDPVRDDVTHISEFVSYFNKRFVGLSGAEQDIAALAKNLGVMFEKTPPTKDGYNINHTASIFLANPRGEIQALFSSQADVATIVAETRRLMAAD